MSAVEIIPITTHETRPEEAVFRTRFDAALRKEPHALEELLTPYDGVIKGTIAGILLNQDDREDCYQELLEKVWKALSSFRVPTTNGDRAFGAWLRISAKRKALDFKAKDQRKTPEAGWWRSWGMDSEENSWDEEATLIVPEEGFEEGLLSEDTADDLRKTVVRYIKRLPERQRDCFLLFVIDRKQYGEIAEILTERYGQTVTTSAVKSLMSRAREALQDFPRMYRIYQYNRTYYRRLKANPVRWAEYLAQVRERQKTEEYRVYNRKKHSEWWHRQTPEKKREVSLKQRERRDADPERYARWRATMRAYYEQTMSDPERAAKRREQHRIAEQRRHHGSEEAREKRKASQKAFRERRNANETPEQREARRAKQAEYNRRSKERLKADPVALAAYNEKKKHIQRERREKAG